MHVDAALSLLLSYRVAWRHLLPLGLGNRAPNWTTVLNERLLGLPLPRHRVRLSLYSWPCPILCLCPPAFPTRTGEPRPDSALRLLPPRGPNELCAYPPRRLRGAGSPRLGVGGRRAPSDLLLSRDPAPPAEALTCSTARNGTCAWSRPMWSFGT